VPGRALPRWSAAVRPKLVIVATTAATLAAGGG
jgi:hypothetical protein